MKTLLLIAFLISVIGLLTSLVLFINLIYTKNHIQLSKEKIKVQNRFEQGNK